MRASSPTERTSSTISSSLGTTSSSPTKRRAAPHRGTAAPDGVVGVVGGAQPVAGALLVGVRTLVGKGSLNARKQAGEGTLAARGGRGERLDGLRCGDLGGGRRIGRVLLLGRGCGSAGAAKTRLGGRDARGVGISERVGLAEGRIGEVEEGGPAGDVGDLRAVRGLAPLGVVRRGGAGRGGLRRLGVEGALIDHRQAGGVLGPPRLGLPRP